MKVFRNALVYFAGEGLKRRDLFFGEYLREEAQGAEEIALPEDAIVLPGFVDEHIHGAGGADAMDGTCEALSTIAATLPREGTTTFLATTMTQSTAAIERALSAVDRYMQAPVEGARLAGVHLEGPFIAEKYRGAQALEYVAPPEIEVFDRYQKASGGHIRICTLAPEREGAQEFIRHLVRSGVLVSVGHSGAKASDVMMAVDAGAKHVTHTFNAQSPLHHREAGVVGSALLCDGRDCELICDCIHVSVPAMQLLVKCKTPRRLILITDAIRAKGMGDGESELGGQKVFVHGGEARLADGTLAGSVLPMNIAVKNLTERVGVPFLDAVDCATINPARALGLDGEIGSIHLGKRADLTILDRDFHVVMTFIGGYRR